MDTHITEVNDMRVSGYANELSLLSQRLADELRADVTVCFRIGEAETTATFSPESRGSPQRQGRRTPNLAAVLEQHLKLARREQYFQLLHKLLEPPADYELFYDVSMVLLRYINSQNLTEQIARRISLYNLTQSNEHSRPAETAEYLCRLSGVVFDFIKESEIQRGKTIVDMLVRYIHENLHEDLSLARLSETAHYNPTYLSRLFKQERGEKLSEFILNARMDKAKELLSDGKLKINKIAKKVGYESSHSFARTFKNTTGMSPYEYKNNQLGSV